MQGRCGLWVVAGLLVMFGGTATKAQTMTPLGTFGGTSSQANDVSADGSVVVGWAYTANNVDQHAFLFDGTTFLDLGTLGGTISYARGASADGTVVVGVSSLAGDNEMHAFRYSAGVMLDLGTLGGRESSAEGISADGLIVVGSASLLGDVQSHAFRLEGGVMQDLGTLGGSMSVARDVSADGSVIAGTSYLLGDEVQHAVRWDSGIIQDLGTLGGDHSLAYAISANGQFAVGTSDIAGNEDQHAFRHDDVDGMIDLGTLGGENSQAYGVSADGSVVVGVSQITPGDTTIRAFRYWAGEMVDIGTLGGRDSLAFGVSDDGSVIVGVSDLEGDTAYRAFVYRQQMQDHANLMASVARTADETLLALSTAGRSSRSLLRGVCGLDLTESLCVGAILGKAGDVEGGSLRGRFGGELTIAPHVTLGAVGSYSPRSLEGSLEANGEWGLGGYVDIAATPDQTTGPLLHLATSFTSSEVDITRGLGLENVELGSGSTALESVSAGARFSHGLMLSEGATLSPFVGLEFTSSTRHGYTEAADIDFPVSYGAFTTAETVAVVGVALDVDLAAGHRLGFEASLEGAIDASQSALAGQSEIPGLSTFSFDGSLSRNALRGALTASYQFALDELDVVTKVGVLTPHYGAGVLPWASVGLSAGF